jgi:hypothetical protein
VLICWQLVAAVVAVVMVVPAVVVAGCSIRQTIRSAELLPSQLVSAAAVLEELGAGELLDQLADQLS